MLNEEKRLTKLTTSLLELNDFDTYGPILKRQNFDIVDVIRETRNTLEGVFEKKKISFFFFLLQIFNNITNLKN